MPQLPELIVYPGFGKTGSTSVQFALRQNPDILEQQNARYIGLMLEEIPTALEFPWCERGDPDKFFRQRNRAKAQNELIKTLMATLRDFADQGVTRVIWSNEGFATRTDAMIPIFQRLAAEGVPLRFVIYARRHDKWAASAYVQWALIGKMYKGNIRPFRDWIDETDIARAPHAAAWREAFPGRCTLYNFDDIPDIVTHFCKVCDIEGIESKRSNVSPSQALVAAWTVFNNRFQKPVRPKVFRPVARALGMMGGGSTATASVPGLERLYPSTEDLAHVRALYQADRDQVNQFLNEDEQPPLAADQIDAKPVSLDSWEMDQMLLKAVFSLQAQITELQDEISQLKADR